MGNEGDWWSREGRFGVMCVHGYSDRAGSYDRSARSGALPIWDFYVCDLNREGEVLSKRTGAGKTLDERKVQVARDRAIRQAEELNEREALHV